MTEFNFVIQRSKAIKKSKDHSALFLVLPGNSTEKKWMLSFFKMIGAYSSILILMEIVCVDPLINFQSLNEKA